MVKKIKMLGNAQEIQTYETMEIEWVNKQFIEKINLEAAQEFLKYAGFLVKRGLIMNTFGNIGLRVPHGDFPEGIIYTKHRGVSLEECEIKNIVITGIESNDLLYGKIPPSNGHQMNRKIMHYRKDVNAVIHTHSNIVNAFFSHPDKHSFIEFIGNDTALVLGASPRILPRHINLEENADHTQRYVENSNCFIMPNHGLVTVGRSLSEAYHRHTSFVAEIERIVLTHLLYQGTQKCFLDSSEVQRLYTVGNNIIYGGADPSN